MKKIRLIHIITGLGIGGAEKVVYDLCRFANKEEFDSSVFVIGKYNEMLPLFKADNIKVQFIQHLSINRNIPIVSRFLNAFFRLIGILQLIKETNKKEHIDIIHAHMAYPGVIAPFIKLLYPSIKIVFTSHNFNLKSRYKEALLRFTKIFRTSDIVFSEDMKGKMYKKNTVVFANGIHTKEYALSVPKFEKFTFLCVGRLVKEKNQMALIKPVQQLKEKGYDFQMLLAGQGVDRSQIENAVKEHQIEDYYKFLGVRRDIPELCNAVHCFILPSLFEGLPISILEAGASSLPVIATDVGSIASVINQDTGYLITDTSKIVGTMEEVINNYKLAKEKGIKLKEKIQLEFDVKAIVLKHENLYKQLIYNGNSLEYKVI